MRTPKSGLISASILSNLGDGIQLAAIPLLALAVFNSPISAGVVLLARIAPALLLAAPIGVIADRHNRFYLAACANIARGLALAVSAVLMLTGVALELWHLIVLSAILGAVEPLFETSVGAAIPEVVEDHELHKYNSLLAFAQTLANGVIGPLAGAILFAVLPSAPFLTNVVLLSLSTACLIPTLSHSRSRVSPQSHVPVLEHSVAPTKRSYREDMLAGWRVIRDRPIIAGLLLLTAGWNLIGWMPEGPLAYYVTVEVGGSESAFAWILATTAIGSLIGSALAPVIRTTRARKIVIISSTPIYGAAFVAVYFSPNLFLTGIIFVIQGLPLILWSITSTTLRQKLVDNRYLGRVNALFYAAAISLGPAGMALGSVVAEVTSARFVFLISGSVLVTLALVLFAWVYRPTESAASLRRQLTEGLRDKRNLQRTKNDAPHVQTG